MFSLEQRLEIKLEANNKLLLEKLEANNKLLLEKLEANSKVLLEKLEANNKVSSEKLKVSNRIVIIAVVVVPTAISILTPFITSLISNYFK